VQCSDNGCTDAVTARIYSCWNYGATDIEPHTKTDPSLVEEDAPFLKTYMSRREYKSWSWISRRLKPGMTVLAQASTNFTYGPKIRSSIQNLVYSHTLTRDIFLKWIENLLLRSHSRLYITVYRLFHIPRKRIKLSSDENRKTLFLTMNEWVNEWMYKGWTILIRPLHRDLQRSIVLPLLINSLSILHFEWNVWICLWGRHGSYWVP
jgi:hypothetical protein